jgi:hypothetical protein
VAVRRNDIRQWTKAKQEKTTGQNKKDPGSHHKSRQLSSLTQKKTIANRLEMGNL